MEFAPERLKVEGEAGNPKRNENKNSVFQVNALLLMAISNSIPQKKTQRFYMSYTRGFWARSCSFMCISQSLINPFANNHPFTANLMFFNYFFFFKFNHKDIRMQSYYQNKTMLRFLHSSYFKTEQKFISFHTQTYRRMQTYKYYSLKGKLWMTKSEESLK